VSASRVKLPKNAGDDPVSASALALQPEALAAFNTLYGTLWSHGVLDHPSKEIARLRNARKTNCVFCKNVRFSQARSEGLVEAQVEQVRDGYESSELTRRQKLILRFSDVFLDDPHDVNDALKQAMRDEFSPAEIVELTAGLALFMGFSKIAVALGGMPESLPTFEMPTPQ
jgi:alkylhydroperoxidase family enzyme